MRYRLDSQHYVDDKLLEAGTEVGDDTPFPWRYTEDTPGKDKDGNPITIKAGTAKPPSMQMSALDEEARRAIKDAFGTDAPDKDLTKGIPLQGSADKVKVQAPGVPRPGSTPQAQHAAEVQRANPAPNPPPTREPAKPVQSKES